MCHKIRCDGESWKLFGFQGELNKALMLWFVIQFWNESQLKIYVDL